MANVITQERAEKIRRLLDEGLSPLEIAGEVQISKDRIERFLDGQSDTNVNGVAPVDEVVADSRNSALAAESRAREARASTAETRANLERRAVERELLQFAADHPAASGDALQVKLEELVEAMHQKDLDLLEQGFAADMGRQTEIIERLQARPAGTGSELETLGPIFERLGTQIVSALQDLGERAGTRIDRVGVQLEARMPPAGFPTFQMDPPVDVDKLLSDLVGMSDTEVLDLGATLLGPEGVRGFENSPDDLRLRLAEVAEKSNPKPASVGITQWPPATAMLPIAQLGPLLQGFLQGLNLPDLRIGGGQNGAVQPLTGSAAPAEVQAEEARVEVLRLRCPQCGMINAYDLNALRGSQSRYEPCACGILIDLTQYLGGESASNLPRYRPI